MELEKKVIRKTLEHKLTQLNDIIADIDQLLTNMQTEFFRVSIFGSARITPESDHFKQVEKLAYELSLRGADIVTGGGPGLMKAANAGAQAGSKKSRSIGLPIDLPFETAPNAHLDVKRQHRRFSSRLDEFMRISHAVVVTPGGIGTILELFYTWQLIQVKHIKQRPMILLGGKQMWTELREWLKKWPVNLKLISDSDLSYLKICDTVEDAIDILDPEIKKFYNKNL
jgi:uncharacterized protein (TIGR00730 family)